ncbi:acyltransferase [Vibrio sp. SCSIO 43136]|uniref:acyltransferase n=1 Tax=Vibrio sp. SCSIO 43136 TaxID=2819101 RepID=UPI00207600A2|nr:acyltransferase [Vibrio sp. SCSIO 43136]USD67792.1 acyltransferase [Vibrio sp. SCSIO 43136]
MTSVHQLKLWLKDHPNPAYRQLFVRLKQLRAFELPTPKVYNQLVSMLLTTVTNCWQSALRVLLFTPAFKAKAAQHGNQLYIYGGTPLVTGPLNLTVGSQCRISGHTTFSARTATVEPQLIIANNVGIGWQTTIAVGTKVVLGNNVRIAGQCNLFGYSGHPIDAKRRAAGEPDDASQVGDIVLEDDVWLGSKVVVMSGVTIGQGTVVAAGSIVTKSLPSNVIAAGNPAKVIKSIKQEA